MFTECAAYAHSWPVKSNYTTLLFTGPCTPLHGIRADQVVVSGIRPLAESDFKWAGCVTMSGRLVRE